ncbi:hypothetical protein CVIRNUC_003147 [Coccomyxa viridis]|uniref:Uncharacterized protein n=1 Tax=Coccomyxa viridis TaxID=1274662 RepID=A0AAV1HYW2_9CHLO|nr:hypothetical protein CVIRNUC_003147 [Coccomyxa viridis]
MSYWGVTDSLHMPRSKRPCSLLSIMSTCVARVVRLTWSSHIEHSKLPQLRRCLSAPSPCSLPSVSNAYFAAVTYIKHHSFLVDSRPCQPCVLSRQAEDEQLMRSTVSPRQGTTKRCRQHTAKSAGSCFLT